MFPVRDASTPRLRVVAPALWSACSSSRCVVMPAPRNQLDRRALIVVRIPTDLPQERGPRRKPDIEPPMMRARCRRAEVVIGPNGRKAYTLRWWR